MTTLAIPHTAFLRQMLRRLEEGFLRLADAGTMAQAVRRLSAKSDADLARAGTTRRAEMDRIFGLRTYL